MTYGLANVEGRAALVVGEHWYDLATVSAGELGADVVTTRIDGIGTLTNRCLRIGDHRVC